jgi:L,D-transpeptidase YcbB
MVMRRLRKTTLWLSLAGSVSLLSLPALAEGTESHTADSLRPVLVEPAAEPSFRDVALDPKAEQPSRTTHDIAIPVPESAAPVAITGSDLKPADPLNIPLPDPTMPALTRSDWFRIAVESRLADEVAMRELRLNRADREALAAFYAQAERPLAWAQDGTWTPAAHAAIGQLKAAAEDGLDPTDYPLPDLALRGESSPSEWAEADLKLSVSVIRYARDARGGRIEPSRLSALITPKLDLPAPGEVLAQVAAAKNAGAALAAYHPSHPGYQALKARLAHLRANHPSQPNVRVPKGPPLRVGMQDPRVPLIRARFNLTKGANDQTVYDERVASAVAAFQKEIGLPTNGVLTSQTAVALSGPSSARIEGDLIANMERWRWLPADLGSRHIMVNVPEYRLRFVDEGSVIHQTRVIVGKQESQTPIFSEDMKYLVVNPSWTVPPSILKKEFLPGLAVDPYYAERRGYKVIRSGNRISVQQPPGERNALGFVKFMFPNQHAVYLHDTPNRSLFTAGKRAFSHGCVRVEQPFELAQEILGQDGKWSEQKLKGLIGKGERYVYLRQPVPVHLTYFTISIDERGELKTFEDLYGIDRKVRAALGFSS